jgi:lipopolysaccharide export system permease protein
MLMSQAALYLSKIAKGSLAITFFGKLILINIPMLASYILPFAFFMSALLAYGRLYAESEMVVLQASGFSNRRLFAYTCVIALPIFLLSAYLILVVSPTILRDKGQILTATADNILQSIVPGEFRSLDNGNVVMYVSSANHNRTQLKDVFVAQFADDKSDGTRSMLTVSYMDHVKKVVIDGHAYLQGENSYQYKGIPGEANYTISHYKTYAGLMPQPALAEQYSDTDSMSTSQLWHQHNTIKEVSELQWRISLVLQVIVLTLMVLPLSRINPRQGRYAKILPAILFYFVFANLLFFARYLLESGKVNSSIGVWWVFVLMLLVALYYNAKTYNWFARFKK